jgi:hypothetical protein
LDIVYVYKRTTAGRELKYSLRSACKNLSFDQAHVVGDAPLFRHSLNHIQFQGAHGKHENAFSKLKAAIESREVSDPFVLFNDDFFILQRFAEIPYLYTGRLIDWLDVFPHRSAYYQKAQKTLSLVGERALIFEVHFPIVYFKDKLRFLIKKYDLPAGIMLRTLYCNEYKVHHHQSSDYKARSAAELMKYSQMPFCSTSEQAARTQTFRNVMSQLFPDRSRFEIS